MAIRKLKPIEERDHYAAAVLDSFDKLVEESIQEIKTVHKVTRDGGEYTVQCPHCNRILGIEGDDMSEIRGEQYQDRICGGWFEISNNARYVKPWFA